MAPKTNNAKLRRQALTALAAGRAEISEEIERLRTDLSPARIMRRVVSRHGRVMLFTALAAGIVPVLLVFGKRLIQGKSRAVTINVNKPQPKAMLSVLLAGAFGMLAKAVTPALIKSVVVSPLKAFLDKKRP